MNNYTGSTNKVFPNPSTRKGVPAEKTDSYYKKMVEKKLEMHYKTVELLQMGELQDDGSYEPITDKVEREQLSRRLLCDQELDSLIDVMEKKKWKWKPSVKNGIYHAPSQSEKED